MKNKDLMGAMKGLTYLTQVGISIATPMVLMLLLANYLVTNGFLGMWAYALFIILGLGGGIMSFYSFTKYVMSKNAKKSKTSQERTVPDELRGKLE